MDLALVVVDEAHDPTAVTSLERSPLLEEELLAIAAADQQFEQHAQALTLRQLARLPQIVFSESYDLRAVTMQAYQAQQLSPNVVVEGAEMDAVLRFVERGLGVAVVPATVLLDRPRLRSRRLVKPSLTRTIALARPRDVTLSRAAEQMQKLILETVTQLAQQHTALRSLAG